MRRVEAGPFLTIVTRTCMRPRMLAQCIESVLAQTCHDLEIVFIVDRIGSHLGGNMAWANSQFAVHKARPSGRYVFMLDDDGVLVSPNFVERLRATCGAKPAPDAVLTKSLSLDKNGATVELPPPSVWGLAWERGARPLKWAGHGYNSVARTAVWRRVVGSYVGKQRGGDWHYHTRLLGMGLLWARLSGVHSARSQMRGYGERFERCPADWWEQTVKQFGIEDIGNDDWRLRLWQR